MNQKNRQILAIKLLPFAFAIHNFEEAWVICKFGYGKIGELQPFTVVPLQFIVAVSLFTTLGFIIVFAKRLYKNAITYDYATTGFAGMLFLNSFFPHIISTIYFRTYTLGIISTVLLILPLTAFILYRVHKNKIFTKKQFLLTIFVGGVIGMVLVYLFLSIASLFS